MGAHEWTTAPQREFLLGRLSIYLAALWRDWFEKWPEEAELGFPLRVAGAAPLTTEELKQLGESTNNKKERLKTWMRYRDKARRNPVKISKKTACSLFRILEKEAVKRALRPQEMYQKLYGAKIKEEVLKRGYGELNEEAEAERAAAAAGQSEQAAVTILTEDERVLAEMMEDALALARVHKNRALRMSLWRTTSIEMYQLESDDVKKQIEAATAQFNSERIMPAAADDDKRTPLEYQHGIDQLGHVLSKVHEATMKETGWVGFVMMGGPMPRHGGAISTKTFCFGTTPAGLDFQAVHPTFEDDVKKQFNKFLKRTFSHEVRDRRGIPPGDEDVAMPEGLLAFEGSDVEDDQGVGNAEGNSDSDSDNAVKSSKRAPLKRIRRKMRTKSAPDAPSPAAPVFVVAPAAASSPGTTEPDAAAFASATDFDAMPISFASTTNFDAPPLSYSEDWDPSRYDRPEDFEMVLGNMMSDSTSTSSFSLGTTENAWSDGGSLSMPEEFAPVPAARPVPWAAFRGAAFEKDRERPLPGVLQASKPRGGGSSSSSPPFTFGANTSAPFTFTPSSTAETLRPVASHQLEAPITVVNTTPKTSTSTSTAPMTPTTIPAPRPQGPPIHLRPSALSVFSSVVANATAAVGVQCAPASSLPAQVSSGPPPQLATVALPGPPQILGSFQSRPMGNAPKEHPAAAVPKTTSTTKKRGRPRKTPAAAAIPAVSESVQARRSPTSTACESMPGPAIPDQAPAPPTAAPAPSPATLTGATATAEVARIRREDTTNCKLRIEIGARAARLHNPAGGADLFITGSCPKRAVTATKNPDGSAWTKKWSPAELAAEEDQRMLDRFASQKRKAVEDLLELGTKKGKMAAKGKTAALATGGTGKRKAAGPAATGPPAKKTRARK
ncbi:hypothetical protein B0H13DRAFT_2352603 [Mycena leptocephala]|nr:hypothetical protein B0H13DRAFT_2352603 [Mycena leptocephala]